MASVWNWPDFELTKDTPYLTGIGKIWSVLCKYLYEKLPNYK